MKKLIVFAFSLLLLLVGCTKETTAPNLESGQAEHTLKKVAFIKKPKDANFLNCDLYLINMDGSKETLVDKDIVAFFNNDSTNQPVPIKWSPDGNKLVYLKNNNIIIFDINTKIKMTIPSIQFNLSKDNAFSFLVSWSPDSKKIAYLKDLPSSDNTKNANFEIYVKDLSSDIDQRLTYSDYKWFSSVFPTWSPDGNKIAYYEYGSSPSINTIKIDGSDLHKNPLSQTKVDGEMVWSKNGSGLYYYSVNSWNYIFYLNLSSGTESAYKIEKNEFCEMNQTFQLYKQYDKTNNLLVYPYILESYTPYFKRGKTEYDFRIAYLKTAVINENTENSSVAITPDNDKGLTYYAIQPCFSGDYKTVVFSMHKEDTNKIKSLLENMSDHDLKSINQINDELVNFDIYSVSVTGQNLKKITDGTLDNSLNLLPVVQP